MALLLGIALGLVFVAPVVLAYALFVRWCDRFEPEPWWLLACAFLWGAIFATAGGGITSALGEALASAVTGLAPDAPRMQALGATVFAPVFEEGFKGLGVGVIALASALGLRELDGPLDGAIYGGIVGLGFTLTEDTLYVANQLAEGGLAGFVALFFLRTVLLGLSHCTFTAMTGLGFGVAAESRSPVVKLAAPLGGYAAAMAMHAVHNALPTFFGDAGLALMVLESWVVDLLFFALLAALVVRDRAIVARELAGEVGALLHDRELRAITTYVALGRANLGVLFARGWAEFRARRTKQLALVELAFVKSRRRRGEHGAGLDAKEASLRGAIADANARGVWLA
jgi:RsiW-degrading membrane proteinase PrsW (M82 family)